MSRSSDVIVIGGGVIGLAIARCLKLQGHEVVVFERGKIGREASWAAAGMLAPHCEFDPTDPFFDFCHTSLKMYPAYTRALYEETGIDIEYQTAGTIFPATNDQTQKKLESQFKVHTENGHNVIRLSAKEARRLEPNLTSDLQMALMFPDDHQVENRKLSQALLMAAERASINIFQQTPVTRVLIENNQAVGVETSGGRWESNVVVNAAGSWARHVAGMPAICSPPIRPVRGQMVALQTGDVPAFRHMIYAGKTYLVPKTHGRLLVGATVEEAGFRKEVTTIGIMSLLQNASKIAPSLKTAAIESTWAGFRPASPDELPVLGPTPVSGIILATGHYRNGILLTPLTGALISEFICSGEVSAVMKPFLLERFDGS